MCNSSNCFSCASKAIEYISNILMIYTYTIHTMCSYKHLAEIKQSVQTAYSIMHISICAWERSEFKNKKSVQKKKNSRGRAVRSAQRDVVAAHRQQQLPPSPLITRCARARCYMTARRYIERRTRAQERRLKGRFRGQG